MAGAAVAGALARFCRCPCRPVSLCFDLVSSEPGMMILQRAQVPRHRPRRGPSACAPWSLSGGGGGVLRPPQGGPSRWRLAPPWPFDPWGPGRAGFRASARLVVVWRPVSWSSPSWRPACQGRYTTALRRLMTFLPADRLRAMVVQVTVSLRAAASLRGSGWPRVVAGPPKGTRAPCLGRRKAPGLLLRSPARLLPGTWVACEQHVQRVLGCGAAHRRPAAAARTKTETRAQRHRRINIQR